MEITASNYAEVFLKDGWKLRFFITSGAKNVSNAYMKFIGRSNHNRKLIRIKRTNQKPAFAECRVLKVNTRGKHDELFTSDTPVLKNYPRGQLVNKLAWTRTMAGVPG